MEKRKGVEGLNFVVYGNAESLATDEQVTIKLGDSEKESIVLPKSV